LPMVITHFVDREAEFLFVPKASVQEISTNRANSHELQ